MKADEASNTGVTPAKGFNAVLVRQHFLLYVYCYTPGTLPTSGQLGSHSVLTLLRLTPLWKKEGLVHSEKRAAMVSSKMNEQERLSFIQGLDNELLHGGVILSEWCSFIVRETDIAFVGSAYLATVVTAVAGIEAYLRSEYPVEPETSLCKLIEQAPIEESLKNDLQALRKYRNRWVHVADPWDDQAVLEHLEEYEHELEDKARDAVRALRRTIYENQWI